MTIKNADAYLAFTVVLILVAAGSFFMLLGLFIRIYSEKKWLNSLKKEELLGYEEILSDCLAKYQIRREDYKLVEEIIKKSGYAIKETTFMPLNEGYTTGKPERGVYVRKFLPSGRKHFTLAHELMHIIYKPEELDAHQQYRQFHSLFRMRNKDEQLRDYMAASFILPRDVFWKEIVDVDYFNTSLDKRKAFALRMAEKYNVETSTVYRRIDELRVLNGVDVF